MTINRQNNGGESRAIKVLMEQVSNLQTDLAQAQSEIDGLDNSKVSKDELAQSVETQTISANSANIGSTTIATDHVSSNDIRSNELHSVNADFEVEHANTGYIEDLTTDALTVNGDETVVNLNAQRVTVVDSLTAPNVITEDANVTNLTATGAVSANSVSTSTVNATEANVATVNVSQELNVNNLNITGNITGLNNVDIVANSIDTPEIEADEISTGSIYTSDVNHLVPSPSLDNNDTYTVQLPVFTGSMFLVWKDNSNNTVWSATVIGDGKNYSIHWSSVGSSLVVTKLYQYNGHAYIKHNANGSLYYSYHTTVKLDDPAVWYNYSALDNIDPDYQHDCTGTSGQVSFGDFYAPKFITGGTSIFDDIDVNGTATIANVNAGTVIGQELTITDGTNTSLHADENGVAVSVDTTITGDLAQTGDQTVTGEVTISEKETISNVQPDVPGYYETHDAWKVDTDYLIPINSSNSTFRTSATLPSEPISQTSVINNVLIKTYQMATGTVRFLTYNEARVNYATYLYDGRNYIFRTNGSISPYLEHTNYTFYKKFNSSNEFYVATSSDTGLRQNTVYYKLDNGYYYYTSDSSTTDATAAEAAILNTKTFSESYNYGYYKYVYNSVKLQGSTYTTSTYNMSESEAATYDLTDLHEVFYTPYQTFVAEPDPTHTYDTTTEVLAVNGSENVTRDLRVQGYLFQDDYHLAHLPNILSNDIKVNDSEVLTEANKGVANGVASLDSTGKVPSAQLPTIPTVVDTVADGNMNAVTSNAVYDYIDAAITQVLNTGF